MDDARGVQLSRRRFGLRALFYVIGCVAIFLAADRATAHLDFNFAVRAMGVIVAWTFVVILLEAWTYTERPESR